MTFKLFPIVGQEKQPEWRYKREHLMIIINMMMMRTVIIMMTDDMSSMNDNMFQLEV